MGKIRILNQQEGIKLMTIEDAIAADERAYVQKAKKTGGLWPMVFHEFDPGHADLDIKSGDLGEDGVFGFKLVSWYEANPGKGLPELFGTSMLFDITTGAPTALINAGALTGLRTGAAAAVGAKYLARKDAKTLLMVGTGMLAPYGIAATLITCPGIKQVRVINPRHPEKTEAKLAAIEESVAKILGACGRTLEVNIEGPLGVPLGATVGSPNSLGDAVSQSDIIITATPARSPIIKSEWVKPGTHISCLGADMTGKQELESALTARGFLYVDDKTQSLDVGESEIPIKEGIMTAENILGEIGEVIGGNCPGRKGDKDITIFDSTGIALQDLACCGILLKKAEAQGVGTVVEFY